MRADSFGDRMKEYESVETGRKLIKFLPIVVRLDGKAFHTFSKQFISPFDKKFHEAFRQTTLFLVEETGAICGYTQSDEISLVFFTDKKDTELFFNRKTMKLTSVLASMCTAKFNKYLQQNTNVEKLAFFDCRVWNVPNLTEAANTILWREKDAIKNSISSLALSHFSAKELHKKSTKERKQMLDAKGICWDALSNEQKRGSYVLRRKIDERSKAIFCDDMSNLSDIANREQVLLGADPILK